MGDARGQILAVAETLFYGRGYRAVGVDRVIAEAGVAKATFYRHFPSKDDLLVAVLEGRDERWRKWLAGRVEALAKTPADRPLAVFDALAERFARRDFRGCAFINSMVELGDRSHPAFVCAQNHKRAVTALIERWLDDAGYTDATGLAQQFVLLIDGAIVTALREGDAHAAARARMLAELLLGPGNRARGGRAGSRVRPQASRT